MSNLPKEGTWTESQRIQVADLLRDLYSVVRKLEDVFERKRKFTPDGHLVGSLGEVLVAYAFNLEVATASTPGYHAVDVATGKQVQIKMTGGNSGIALRCEPQFLIAIRIEASGEIELLYNGPGKTVWEKCGALQSNGQARIGLTELRSLNPISGGLEQVRNFPDLRSV